jgi:hypothetical protein
LREVRDEDLPLLFEQWADPVAAHMAAFTAPDHMDRDAFERRWSRLRADETVLTRVIVVDDEVAGTIGSWGETSIRGETAFRWLPGGFFLEQHVQLDFMGLQIDSLELIGYDPETDRFPSVFSNLAPTPLPYRYDVNGDDVTISVSYGPLDATFTGSWREDGTFSGGWRPNPGADETVNVPYDIGGHRLA